MCDKVNGVFSSLYSIIINRKKRDGKRAYTEEELASAISDVRSGKIGTRRASSLYGIPRSTLRNKIFKVNVEVNNLAFLVIFNNFKKKTKTNHPSYYMPIFQVTSFNVYLHKAICRVFYPSIYY